jgi:hypothetical protein
MRKRNREGVEPMPQGGVRPPAFLASVSLLSRRDSVNSRDPCLDLFLLVTRQAASGGTPARPNAGAGGVTARLPAHSHKVIFPRSVPAWDLAGRDDVWRRRGGRVGAGAVPGAEGRPGALM